MNRAAGALVLAVLLAAGCNRSDEQAAVPRGAPESVTLATTPYSGTVLVYIALARGFFESEGLKVAVQSHSSGGVALEAVLAGSADVSTVAELPVTLAAAKGRPVVLLATIATGEGDFGLVGRKDRGVSGPAALKGKRVAVTPGSSGEFFLDALLVRQKLSRADVRRVNRKAQEMVDALENGDADAVATWEPYVSAAARRLETNSIVIDSAGVYDSTFNLAATRDFVSKRGATVRKLLRAFVRAEQFYAKDRAEAEKIVADALKIPLAEARQLLSKHRVGLSLDQGLLTMMEDEARWAMKGNLLEVKAMPNFLENVHLDGLLSVKPRAVTIIH